MPGTTPKYGFPYPIATDTLAAFPGTIKDLAEKVEGKIAQLAAGDLPVGFTPVRVAGPWTVTESGTNLTTVQITVPSMLAWWSPALPAGGESDYCFITELGVGAPGRGVGAAAAPGTYTLQAYTSTTTMVPELFYLIVPI